MQIEVNIPNIGLVTIDGDFATESAIKKLEREIKNFDPIKSDNSLRDFLEELEEGANDLDSFATASVKAEKNLGWFSSKLRKGLDKISFGFFGLSEKTSGISKAFDKTTDGISNALGNLPVVGGVLQGGFSFGLGAVTAFGYGLYDFIGGLETLNRNMFDTGQMFTRTINGQVVTGLDTFVSLANEAKLPFREFTAAIQANANQLRILAGGQPGGIPAIAKGFKELSTIQKGQTVSERERLFSLGYTTDDMVSAMTEYAVQAKIAGQRLSAQELAEGTSAYLYNLRELSRITGKTLEEEKSKLDEIKANYEIQSVIQGLATAEQKTAATNMVSFAKSLGFSDRAIAGFLRGFVIPTDEVKALWTSGGQDLLTAMATSFGKIGDKTFEPTQQVAEQARILNSLSAEQIERMQTLGGQFVQVPDILLPLQEIINNYRGAQEAANTALDQGKIKNEDLTESLSGMVGKLDELKNSVTATWENMLLPMFQGTEGLLGETFDLTKGVLDSGNNVVTLLKEYLNSDRTDADREKLFAGLSKEGDLVSKRFDDFLTKMGDRLIDAIKFGIYEGYQLIKSDFGSSLFSFGKSTMPGLNFGSMLGNSVRGMLTPTPESKEDLLSKREGYEAKLKELDPDDLVKKRFLENRIDYIDKKVDQLNKTPAPEIKDKPDSGFWESMKSWFSSEAEQPKTPAERITETKVALDDSAMTAEMKNVKDEVKKLAEGFSALNENADKIAKVLERNNIIVKQNLHRAS